MNRTKISKLYQILKQLNEKVFNTDISEENLTVLNITYPTPDSSISVIGYLSNSVLTEIMKIGKDENVFGPVVDLLMVYMEDLAEAIIKDGLKYSKTQIALLVPESPFGLSRREEKYQRDCFSPVEGPSDEKLEELNICIDYTVIDLAQNREIKILYDQILNLA